MRPASGDLSNEASNEAHTCEADASNLQGALHRLAHYLS
jgi:hypothetical protein